MPAVTAAVPTAKPAITPIEDKIPVEGILVLVAANDASNVISWTPINDNATYNIYWSTTPGVNKKNGSKIYGAVSPQPHTGVINGTTYYYVVTEVINGVEGKESMQVSAIPIVPGDPVAGKAKSLLCQGCHGENGNSTDTDIPKLAGQYAKYIAKQLRNYQSGTRTHAIMSSMAATISDADLADISAHFATQPKMKGDGSGNPVAMNLFLHGDKSRKLLACVNCHGVNGKGLTPNTSMFPVIGGQYKDYIRSQLLSFRKGFRTNSPNGIMNLVTSSMSDAEVEALAEYVSGL